MGYAQDKIKVVVETKEHFQETVTDMCFFFYLYFTVWFVLSIRQTPVTYPRTDRGVSLYWLVLFSQLFLANFGREYWTFENLHFCSIGSWLQACQEVILSR
jgi:hypothetical protein